MPAISDSVRATQRTNAGSDELTIRFPLLLGLPLCIGRCARCLHLFELPGHEIHPAKVVPFAECGDLLAVLTQI